MNIQEILESKLFEQNVKKELSNLIKQRLQRPALKPGFKYKRDWYDRLEGQLNKKFIIDNYKLVLLKVSDLPTETRRVVNLVGLRALDATIKEIKELQSTNHE